MNADALGQSLGSGGATRQATENPAEADLEGKEEKAFIRWLGRHFVIFARIVLAVVLTLWAALPLVSTLRTRLGDTVFSISDVPRGTRSVTDPIASEETRIMPGQKNGQKDQSAIRGREEAKGTLVVLSVQAYGIQIAGLLAALAGTFWAIVALSRVE